MTISQFWQNNCIPFHNAFLDCVDSVSSKLKIYIIPTIPETGSDSSLCMYFHLQDGPSVCVFYPPKRSPTELLISSWMVVGYRTLLVSSN